MYATGVRLYNLYTPAWVANDPSPCSPILVGFTSLEGDRLGVKKSIEAWGAFDSHDLDHWHEIVQS